MLQQFLVLIHVVISIALIALVLIQQGKGAELGATFGSAASQTVFGSQGSASFLLKLFSVLKALAELLRGAISPSSARIPIQTFLSLLIIITS
jgi:preprotein translocase subunit SecG